MSSAFSDRKIGWDGAGQIEKMVFGLRHISVQRQTSAVRL